MYTVAETIHHGGYSHTTSRTSGEPRTALEAVLDLSPYYSGLSVPQRDAIYRGLAIRGRAKHGWATYTLTKTA